MTLSRPFYSFWTQRRTTFLLVISWCCCFCAAAQPSTIPDLVTPVYHHLKNLHVDIPLVTGGRPVSAIVAPRQYTIAASLVQIAIERATHVKVPIISDTVVATPFELNLIILGNRSTSRISSELYDRYYSLMDLRYPGAGGYSVRSLHNPYGNGFSAILVGGSDIDGVTSAAEAFAIHVKTLPASKGELAAGWIMLTKLGAGVRVPTDIRDFETWEASKGYGSTGYFGWNSLSKRMAMYYMTGDPFHAREAIRLAFPDASALKEIDEVDGERIENKNDPLAGPYHYNAMMLILYWDLIEESPVFSDDERLKVTNAFARRFEHEGTPPFDKETYKRTSIGASVGSRHGQWSALSVLTLARYFNKYYPSPMWAQAERAGRLSFASLHDNDWVVGEGDQLNWYATGIAPVLVYMVLTGDREPIENGVLQHLLRGHEVLMSGRTSDWALRYAALNYFTQAAYLTGDGRWLNYFRRTQLDTTVFRLGQSFWPGEDVSSCTPDDLVGKWTVTGLPEPMWLQRKNGFSVSQSFQNMSYRSAADASGDFILLDGYNGAYRNPYHTFDILELRLNGTTLLDGYHNQVATSADGMVAPEVAMDAALLFHGVTGNMTAVVGEVPDLPFANWRRSIAMCKGRYVLIADDVAFRNDSDNMLVEVTWEMPGAVLDAQHAMASIRQQEAPAASYELHTEGRMKMTHEGIVMTTWRGAAKKGTHQLFFHLLGENATDKPDALANVRLAPNAAALALPEPAVTVSGEYEGLDGGLVVLSGQNLYGHALRTAGLSKPFLTATVPVEADWNFARQELTISNSQPVTLALALETPGLVRIDGKPLAGKEEVNGLYTIALNAGQHEFEHARIAENIQGDLIGKIPALLQKGREMQSAEIEKKSRQRVAKARVLKPAMKTSIHVRPASSVIIPASDGDGLALATGTTITILDGRGHVTRNMSTSGEIKVLHWWPETNLLLAGCADEKVIAFDTLGVKKWEFTSVMDPAVYEAGKPYWFKSAYPGVAGLYSGVFDHGKSRAFIGSACTLEILDEAGQLVRRMPVFWGSPRQFLMVDAGDGSKNLLAGRWQSDRPNLAIINSEKLKVTGFGYVQVPDGHTFVNGWMAMNRFDNFQADLDGDGKKEIISAINGTWNRVTVYSEEGKPLYNAQFGAGSTTPRSTMRMMDVGDLSGDGRPEVVIGVASGVLDVLDGKLRKQWAKVLSSPPVVLKIVQAKKSAWLCVASEDGTVTAMNAEGKTLRKGTVNGRPVDLQVMRTAKGSMAVVTTDNGEVTGFRIFD